MPEVEGRAKGGAVSELMAALFLRWGRIMRLPGGQLRPLLPRCFGAWCPAKGTASVLLRRLCAQREETWWVSGLAGSCLGNRLLSTAVPPPPGTSGPDPKGRRDPSRPSKPGVSARLEHFLSSSRLSNNPLTFPSHLVVISEITRPSLKLSATQPAYLGHRISSRLSLGLSEVSALRENLRTNTSSIRLKTLKLEEFSV